MMPATKRTARPRASILHCMEGVPVRDGEKLNLALASPLAAAGGFDAPFGEGRPASRSRVTTFHHLLQVRGIHVRVHLGRANVRMSQHFLHGTQISPAREQVRGEGVTEHVGMHVPQACGLGMPAHDPPDSNSRQRTPSAGEQELI